MRTYAPIAALVCVLTVIPAVAQDDAEHDEPLTLDPVVNVMELDAPIDEVWAAFTTKDGAESWMVPVAEFDLRSGGTLRTSYDTENGLDGDQVITHHLLVVDAPRLLVAQTDAPAGNPMATALQGVTGVWEFDSLGPDRTRVTLSQHGWKNNEDSKRTRGFFESANPTVLAKLEELFPPRPSDADIFETIAQLEGAWEHELETQGGTMLIKKTVEPGPGRKSWMMQTSFVRGGRDAMHKQTQVWLETPTGPVRFQALDENGVRASGLVRRADDGALWWDSEEPDGDGGRVRGRIEMRVVSDDAHRFAVHNQQADGTFAEAFGFDYRRAE